MESEIKDSQKKVRSYKWRPKTRILGVSYNTYKKYAQESMVSLRI